MQAIDPLRVKAESEARINAAGGRICDWLPYLDRTQMRSRDQIVARALVLNALNNIAFEAPVPVIRDWIHNHGLDEHLSLGETQLLRKKNADLTRQELIDLSWSIEALWALMWVGGLAPDLPFDRGVEDYMASLAPNLEQGDGPEKFADKMAMRDQAAVFRMLDLYFRLHWWVRDSELTGRTAELKNILPGVIVERRKALEWVMDAQIDWDEVPMDT